MREPAVGSDAAEEHVLRLSAPDGQVWPIAAPRGEKLDDDLPWIFDSTDNSPKLLRQGSGSVTASAALVAIPPDWTVVPGSDGTATPLGHIHLPARQLFRISGTVRFSSNQDDACRIRTGRADTKEEIYEWVGQRSWQNFLRPGMAFLGRPRLFQTDEEGRSQPISSERGWRQLGARPAPGTEPIGPIEVWHLAYRLAGQERDVIIVVPQASIELVNETDQFLLSSLADHPRIKIATVLEMPIANGGTVFAEVLGMSSGTRWASGDTAASSFGINWATSKLPLIVGSGLVPLALNESPILANELRPRATDPGDREIEIHHQLDGPLQGFGQRFWTMLAEQHPATKVLLSDGSNDDVRHIRYQDRYLFTPLSLALLCELIVGLREHVGRGRWDNPKVTINTTQQRTTGEIAFRNVVWADWPDSQLRDQVAAHVFEYLGIDLDLQVTGRTATQHGRLLEVEFNSGRRLTVRLDQGVSYWRAGASTQGRRGLSIFDFGLDPEDQGRRIAEMVVYLEGAVHPTEVFAKVR